MRIYLVRHGETDWNIVRKLQGRTDIPLNEKGIKAAQKTGEALRNVLFTRAFSSPLKRAMDTAKLILGDRQIPIIPDERIIEISFGEFEGLCSKRGNYEIPDPDFQNFFLRPEAYKPPKGGESLESLTERTRQFIQNLASEKEWEKETILVATHGAAVRGLLNAVTKNPISNFWHGGVPKNCSVSIVECHEGHMNLVQEDKVYYE